MFRYKITSMFDKKNECHKPLGYYHNECFLVKHLSVGTGALLYGDSGINMETSRVEHIHIWENSIKIETTNTIYHLKPVLTGVV